MNEEQAVLLMIKGVISEAPPEARAQIEEAATRLRAVVKAYGDMGPLALGLVGAEMAAAS